MTNARKVLWAVLGIVGATVTVDVGQAMPRRGVRLMWRVVLRGCRGSVVVVHLKCQGRAQAGEGRSRHVRASRRLAMQLLCCC